MNDEVLIEVEGGVATITINRPEAKNAFRRSTADALAAALDDFEARDDVAVGIITGAGGTFSAGMDLKAFAQTGELPTIPGRGFAGIVEQPPRKPLIAAVEGWALAGGFEIALSADLVVAARTAKFGLPEVKRGLIAAAGGLIRLPKVLPYPLAMRVALTGDYLSAEECHRNGLVVELAEEGLALDVAGTLASRIAANGPLAVKATKKVMSESVGWNESEAWKRMRQTSKPIFDTEDAKEGAKAFAEKRPPVWQGR